MKDVTEPTVIYITQRDLERRWRLSGRTLERWRAERYGPAWHVLGGSIRYRLDDIEAFEGNRRRATRGKPDDGASNG